MARESTSYEYSVSLNDRNITFDAYFVSSKDEIKNHLKESYFRFYTQEACYAQNYHSYSGICKNVGKDSGLFIIILNNLALSFTKVKISIHEKP